MQYVLNHGKSLEKEVLKFYKNEKQQYKIYQNKTMK